MYLIIFIYGLGLLAIIGEIMCIVKFCKSDFEPSYKREAIYGISCITGIGCIVGYFDIPDTKK